MAKKEIGVNALTRANSFSTQKMRGLSFRKIGVNALTRANSFSTRLYEKENIGNIGCQCPYSG